MSYSYRDEDYAAGDEPAGRWQRIHRSVGRVRWIIAALVVVLAVVSILLLARSSRSLVFDLIQRVATRKFPAVQWLARDELARWRADAARAQPVLLDARSAPEYRLSHLRGAVRIDPREPALKGMAPFPRDTPVVVYCRVGYRSARVAGWLHRQGFRNVSALEGGLFAWADDGRPLEQNGRPATQVHPYTTTWGRLLLPEVRADAPPVADPLSLP